MVREIAQLRAMVAENDKVTHYLEGRVRDFEVRDSKCIRRLPIQQRDSPAAIHEARERREQDAIVESTYYGPPRNRPIGITTLLNRMVRPSMKSGWYPISP